MTIELESLILKSYDNSNNKHQKFKNSLDYDDHFIKFFGQFFIKNIDEIFVPSKELETNKAYIIEEADNVLGMIRIFKKTFNGELTLQYAVSKEYRNQGYGKKILKEISNYFINNKDISCIKLNIDKNNLGSIECAKKVGYENSNDTYVKYR